MYMKSAKRDQMNMIKRKEMIENRKEYYENLNTEKERAELQEREKSRREAEKAETKRRDEEEKRRTEERSAREEKHKDKLLKMEKVKKLMEHVSRRFVLELSFLSGFINCRLRLINCQCFIQSRLILILLFIAWREAV